MPRHHSGKLAGGLDSYCYVKSFTSWNQFSTLLNAQAGGKRSLRDIQNGLAAQGANLYRLGLSDGAKCSTLADATTINLCLTAFLWARFRAAKGAMKPHRQLDHNGNLPCFVAATDGM